MLSRVAQNLYWMSRYLERVENVARLLDVGLDLELDAPSLRSEDASSPVQIAIDILSCRDLVQTRHAASDRGELLDFLTFDRTNPQSIQSIIAVARENARGTQESLGAEAWSAVNRLYLRLRGRRALKLYRASPTSFYASIKQSCILFDGHLHNTLPRDEVYHFTQLGRFVERTGVLARVLYAHCLDLAQARGDAEIAPRSVRWTALLRICSAHAAFLRFERDRVEPISVVRFLVLNPDFPRAIRFCVGRCRESLHEITGGDDDEYASEAERLMGRLESDLRYIDAGEILERGLVSFLDGVRITTDRAADEIRRSFFLG